jgi:hypothetical protein
MSRTATTGASAAAVGSRRILCGIASGIAGDIEIWYPTREQAEETLAEILRDEPDLALDLWVEPVEFQQSLN